MSNEQEDSHLIDGIAIIGMAGRFPGAQDVASFWKNLVNGEESITFFEEDELSSQVPEQEKQDPHYVRARGILENIDLFDADFFGIPPIEAQIMDPQQRLFLEICWEAMENAGYVSEKFAGIMGVYGGMNNNSYYLQNVLTRPDIVQKIGSFQAMLANEKDFLTTRVSYKLNLTGPSENIYTACSTSLVSIISAFQALMTYQCDMALAGGVSITVPQNSGYLYQDGSMLSPDGHCRPFDLKSEGTTFNNGAGVVVLKRYDEALEDNDHIIAVIRGTGLNNDGGAKVSFTAPSVNGQKEAIRMALAQAEVLPETINYVETHGTGTPLGDPVEVSALTQAFALEPEKGKSCLLGSIKSNVGHMVHAAGVAGLIKTALALHHKVIPATINHNKPNPQINWDKNPFAVCAELTQWPRNQTARRAGVSSFGVGGTNAHIILEESAEQETRSSSLPLHILPFSARSSTALGMQARNLSKHILNHKPVLADTAFTLQNGRKHFNHRCFGIFQTQKEASQVLADSDSPLLFSSQTTRRNPEIVFMFPGQGAQHPHMAEGLYEYSSRFKEIIDNGAEILQPELGMDLRSLIFSTNNADAAQLNQTRIAQPSLFLVEYGLAQVWIDMGVNPAAMIGHSIGELTAACLAGVFSFEDGLNLVAKRGALMQQCPPGAMLSVRLPAEKIVELLSDDIVLSTVNSPHLCVVGGKTEEISLLHERLKKESIPCQILRTSHAFHSPSMEAAATSFAEVMQETRLSPPTVPFVSCVSGSWISEEQAVSSEYWGEQIRSTVQYSKGISLALEDDERIFLEIGPRTSAAVLARQHLGGRDISVLSSLDKDASIQQDYNSFLTACGNLWLNGVEVDWPQIYSNEERSRIPLPTYPFEKKRFWLDPGTSKSPIQPLIDEQPSNNRNSDNMMPEKSNTNTQLLIIDKLATIILESSGIEIDTNNPDQSFLEVGLDSLILTQLATTISNDFEVEITFRQLLNELVSPSQLADYISTRIEPSVLPETDNRESAQHGSDFSVTGLPENQQCGQGFTNVNMPQGDALQTLLSQQIQVIAQQLEIITGKSAIQPVPLPVSTQPKNKAAAAVKDVSSTTTGKSTTKQQKSFGPAAKINIETDDSITVEQQEFLEKLIGRYTDKTKKSKQFAQKNRKHLADPRTVSGFRPLLKEMVYQIVVSKSSGSSLWDIDDNKYIDMLNGFGSNFLGYSPDFVVDAVTDQMQRGIEIGPQHPLTENVADLMTEFTELDRFAFCNTGSEAVLGSMRIARTVTGKKTIVLFSGAYHGIFDEVIVRGTPSLKSFSAAPGINNEAVSNTLVLEYGAEESLKIIKERSKEIAGILVEPVQSRNPALQPKKFLHKLRKIADETGAALIIDEVITGFRIHPRGSQGFFDVDADLASYGKVIGGGLPIGIIGGKKRFMDALDGGQWQYGDNSFPEVGVTYFAGTFVRHPMALAACSAVLKYLQKQGGELQKTMNHRADVFCQKLNSIFKSSDAPIRIDHFGSLMKIQFEKESPFNELLYFLLREKGIHIWDARPIFLTTAHTEQDLDTVLQMFADSVGQLQSVGFLVGDISREDSKDPNKPPVPGARLGKTISGEPAWFIADPDRPGKYIQLT